MNVTTPNVDTIIQGDCLEEMKKLPDKSIDMILCDLPYGTTACKWDHVIPFEPLWKEYKRLIKERGVIVLTASQPFTSALVMSNTQDFKYDFSWDKGNTTGFLNAKKMPLRRHEDILVFSTAKNGNYTYNPQKTKGALQRKGGTHTKKSEVYGDFTNNPVINDVYYPTSILYIGQVYRNDNVHPTQKPVALFEYLIKTYTNEGDLVLDNCIGSGTTAVAAKRTGRHFIGIELSEEYCEIARKRVAAVPRRLDSFFPRQPEEDARP